MLYESSWKRILYGVLVKVATERRCPECGSTKIIHDYDTGEDVCMSCGLVLGGSALDPRPEWRAFTIEENEGRSRVGMPANYSVHNKGLATVLRVGKDASGRNIPQPMRVQMWRLRKWQTSAYCSGDRNLSRAMAELSRLCNRLHIPQSVKEEAAIIYRKALKKNLVRGRSINAIVCASLYAACRVAGVPRTAKEVFGASLVGKKEIARCYRLILESLDVKVPAPDPATLISKIAEPLGISGEVQRRAVEILHKARERRGTIGKEPAGLAAAALYIACRQMGVEATQKEIADAADITEVTLRNRYRSLSGSLELERGKRRKSQAARRP